ncbi:MAG TPA: hypothetical protein VJC13_01340 [Candidatus Paceibacterota bacterium]
MDPNNEPPKVVFDNEQFQRFNQSFQTKTPKIVEWIIKSSGGLIKNENQANYVLIGLSVLAIIISLFLFFSSGGSKAKFVAPTGQKIIYTENEPPRLEKQF